VWHNLHAPHADCYRNSVAESLKALFLLYVKPGAAISRILDRGRLWFAIVAALAVSMLLHAPDIPSRVPSSAILRFISFAPGAWLAPLLMIAAVLVPAIVLIRAAGGFGSFSVLIHNDYSPLLLCVLMSWTAAYLPLAVARLLLDYELLFDPLAFVIFNAYFAVLVVFAVRTIYGSGFGAAIGITALGWIAGVAGAALVGSIGPLLYLLGSPLLLIMLYFAFSSRLQSLGAGLRNRQHFQQQLEIATNNPHDADAHYQLGLIYQQRRQASEAIARFERAVQIDPSFADAHLQLGVIARGQQRFEDAIGHLETAAALDDKLAQNDVWRELGASYFGASRFEEALAALQKFTDRRAYDPEGLYWYGKALAQAGRTAEAREMFERAMEAVNTMPSHRRAQIRQWGNRAKSELR
jgi:tetratricopeptide (TPR) repeat protein